MKAILGYSCIALALIAPALADDRVNAEHYREFWFWGGVAGRPYLKSAQTLYLLQGEIIPDPRAPGAVAITAQSQISPSPHDAPIYLVYRAQSLDFSPKIYDVIGARFARWTREPGTILGVQIDFDGATRNLGGYAAFLKMCRTKLPPGAKLSVTGLMDWAAHAAPEDLNRLAGVVDEIIFQTYRGRATVADIDAYLARLPRLKIPFKLGLVEGGVWREPANLKSNPYFKGYVVFLTNPARHKF